MKLAGKTDVGRVRQDNQDDYRAGELPGDAAWLLVCDGMGGARGGREASQSACDVIEHCFQEQYASKCLPGEEETFLKKSLLSANRFVFQKALREESLAGMGTTAVCALVRGGKVFLCHAGDSRAYLYRDGRLAQLTHDHSALQEARDLAATSGAPQVIPPANVVTKALGAGQSGSVKADYTIMPLEEGDRAVICTDGVHGVLQDSQIHAIVAAGNGPQGTADVLVKASLEAGTRDNSTAVVVYAGTQSRVTLTTNVMNRMIQPVRPASIQTARRVPRREGSD